MAACDMIFEMEGPLTGRAGCFGGRGSRLSRASRCAQVEGACTESPATGDKRLAAPLRQALQRLTTPQGVYGAQILRRVRDVKSESTGLSETEVLWSIVEALTGDNYRASLTRAVGGGGDASCFDRLHHAFVEVQIEDDDRPHGDDRDVAQWPGDLIVEPAFRDAFVIGEQTPRYREVLALVPDEFVGPKGRLLELVRLLCKEMELAFVASGRAVPPWRRFKSVASRWNPVFFRKQMEDRALGPKLGGEQAPVCLMPVGLPSAAGGLPVRGVSGFSVGRMSGVRSALAKDPKMRQDAGKVIVVRAGGAIRAV
eukprot:evm.model.scf_504EXC.1 EVM.evm.TU.scf_504EXC.1   scf_504EXC:8261-9930(-)